jgi:nitrogenase molybdenum-iron protein alpha/beta subunit
MNSNALPSSTSRYEGCTVTGALAVSAFVTDAVSIVHGPAGCAHHNVSLLHYTMLQHDQLFLPEVRSTALEEKDIIFGGEEALEETIGQVVGKGARAVFVISTCITDTIGDDVGAVCGKEWGVPVIHLHSSGFLGGTFNEGFSQALMGVADLAEPSPRHDAGVNLVGEKNLEFEVEENYREVARLLEALGLDVNVRFVRNARLRDLEAFGRGSINIIRDDPGGRLSAFFRDRYQVPSIAGFPKGLQGTCEFLETVGRYAGIDAVAAIREEKALQEEVIGAFTDLRGERVRLHPSPMPGRIPEAAIAREVAGAVGLRIDSRGTPLPPLWDTAVGTAGIRRMLHQWRRALSCARSA